MRATVAVASVLSLAAAAPANEVAKRQAINDGVILNYALTLEHLESKFYRDALKNYTQADFTKAGFGGKFYENLKSVSADENSHVAFLTSALKAAKVTPVAECTYAFPASDPKGFVALASIIEGVGVSAYLGAAASIANKDYLTAAGSILTVESRHSAYLRNLVGRRPFAAPFDAPLVINDVYTLVAPFITSCPKSNPALPVKAFPSLNIIGATKSGSTVTLVSPAKINNKGDVYAAFVAVTGPVFVKTTKTSTGYSVKIPTNALLKGQTYVVLSSASKGAVTDENTIAGPAIIEVV